MNPEPQEQVDHSITDWICHLKDGKEAAAAALWDRFFDRACQLAGKRLAGTATRERDEEDVALSAMNALFCGVRDSRFRKVESRTDLWQILAMITARRVVDVQRRVTRRPEVGESSLLVTGSGQPQLDQLPSVGEEAVFVDSMTVTADEMIAGLEDKLRPVALQRLEGFSNEEIAARQGRSVATIERYLKRIRVCWQDA